MSKFALAAITGALAILATPASAQYGHSQGYGHGHAPYHASYHQPAHHAYHQPSHYGRYGYTPSYHAPRYAPVVQTYEQPAPCYYVLKQHGYEYQKVLVCSAPEHQAKLVEAPAAQVEVAPVEPATAPEAEVPQK